MSPDLARAYGNAIKSVFPAAIITIKRSHQYDNLRNVDNKLNYPPSMSRYFADLGDKPEHEWTKSTRWWLAMYPNINFISLRDWQNGMTLLEMHLPGNCLDTELIITTHNSRAHYNEAKDFTCYQLIQNGWKHPKESLRFPACEHTLPTRASRGETYKLL